ncbi:MAG: TonB-dependent receptor, partial [Candidatus Kapabacteria bacterium]|nr:TonB-dependent receptor [Candidatus Kapabacteria bacterium]
VSLSAGVSYTSGVYSDAANTETSSNGQFGWIPAYTLFDASISCKIADKTVITFSGLNLTNAAYHTVRATVYPGPGILPGDGRTLIASIVQRL